LGAFLKNKDNINPLDMASILDVSQEAIIRAISDESVLKAIAIELTKRSKILYMIAEATLGKVATKEDLGDLKNDLKMYIDARYTDLAARIDLLDKRIDSLDKRIDSLDKRITFLQWVFFVWLSVISLMLSAIIILIQLS